jgi:hypothetical protein
MILTKASTVTTITGKIKRKKPVLMSERRVKELLKNCCLMLTVAIAPPPSEHGDKH